MQMMSNLFLLIRESLLYRMWTLPEVTEVARPNGRREKEDELTAGDCNSAKVYHSPTTSNS